MEREKIAYGLHRVLLALGVAAAPGIAGRERHGWCARHRDHLPD